MELLFPFLLVIFASFFQGTFGLGMKYIEPMSWEAWWIVYSVIAMILFPGIWALIVIPDLWGSIAAVPSSAVWGGMLYGFLWGVGGIMFGISVGYIGVSITYGIVMGLAASVGSLVPLMQIPNIGSNPALPIVIIGVLVMLVGVAMSAIAGIKRDSVQAAAGKEIAGIKTGAEFRKGLVIATVCGALSALLNVGFANALPIAAAAESLGAITRNSSLAAWVVVLFGAFIMNAGYAVVLLIKNNSWGTFAAANSGKAWKWAILTGIFWFAALGVYGQGAALLGSIGPVIGWPMLLGLALIISNVWAVRTGEWEGAQGPFRLMLGGVAVLIVACIILGYSNTLFAG
jgi:L-rhamnose-H+ transport protein